MFTFIVVLVVQLFSQNYHCLQLPVNFFNTNGVVTGDDAFEKDLKIHLNPKGEVEVLPMKINNLAIGNEAYEKEFKKYLDPIRKLAEDFPNHKVEVQFEIIQHPSKVLAHSNPQAMRHKHKEETKHDFEDLHLHQLPTIYNHHSRHRVRKSRPKQQHHVRRQSRNGHDSRPEHDYYPSPLPPSTTKGPALDSFISYVTPPAIQPLHHNFPFSQHIVPFNNQPVYPYQYTNYEITTKKLVNIEDLKKAIEDFERRLNLQAKLQEAKTTNTQATKEGMRPVLKKDLWMALGMKYVTCKNKGCQDEESTAVTDQVTEPSPQVTFRPNNDKIDRIMNLLQKNGVNILDHTPSHSAANNNLQWLQIKIPKNMV